MLLRARDAQARHADRKIHEPEECRLSTQDAREQRIENGNIDPRFRIGLYAGEAH